MWQTLLCMPLHHNNNAQCLKAVMISYSAVSKRKLYNISCQYAVKGKVFTLLHSTPCPCHLPLIVGFENRLRVSGPWSTILCTPRTMSNPSAWLFQIIGGQVLVYLTPTQLYSVSSIRNGVWLVFSIQAPSLLFYLHKIFSKTIV